MFVTSRNVKQYRVPDHLMAPEESSKIGYFALKRVNEEYNVATNFPSKTEYGPDCCKTNRIYGIPCHHLINERMNQKKIPYLSIEDFNQRWLHSYEINIIRNVPNTVSIKKEKKIDDNDWNYLACIHRFERYFTVAKRSIRIQKIFEECLYQLKNTEKESGSEAVIRPPDSLLISGTLTVYQEIMLKHQELDKLEKNIKREKVNKLRIKITKVRLRL